MRWLSWKTGRAFYASLSTNKSLEVSWQWERNRGVDLSWRFRTRGDHAGLTARLSLWTFSFEFNITDNRHFNYEEGRFYLHGEELSDGS